MALRLARWRLGRQRAGAYARRAFGTEGESAPKQARHGRIVPDQGIHSGVHRPVKPVWKAAVSREREGRNREADRTENTGRWKTRTGLADDRRGQ